MEEAATQEMKLTLVRVRCTGQQNWLSLPQPRLFIPAPFLVNKVFILLARRHKAVLRVEILFMDPENEAANVPLSGVYRLPVGKCCFMTLDPTIGWGVQQLMYLPSCLRSPIPWVGVV